MNTINVTADNAGAAADAIAWALVSSPSQRVGLTTAQKREMAKRAATLIEHHREDAERDPVTFTIELFSSLRSAMVDMAYDLAQEDA